MSDPVLNAMTVKLHSRISQLVDQHGVTGAAVGIVRDQELAWSAGFGFADIEAERQPDKHTLFRVGSITKTFTATAIAQLRDEGKLKLDDPIVRHLPEFGAVRARYGTIEDITLSRLLTHHSGLVGEAPLPYWETLHFPSIEEVLATLPEVEVVIEPDSAFKYSNLAYALLGEVIARVSGRPYVEYVRAEILEPLGMTSSVFELTEELRPRMATGYDPHPFEDAPKPSAHPMFNFQTSAAGLYSSVHDLVRWISLQFRTEAPTRKGAQVLRGPSLSELHRAQYMEPDWNFGYCLSWRGMRRGENVFLGHGGGIHGFLTGIFFNKLHRTGVIVLTNMGGGDGAGAIALEMLDRLSEAEKETIKKAPHRKPMPTAEEWEPFLGRYQSALAGLVHIECRDGRLVLVDPPTPPLPSRPPTPLEATGQNHVFLVKSGDMAGEFLTFHFAADGAVTGFTAAGFPFRKLVEAG